MDRAYIGGSSGSRPDTVVLRSIPLEALGWRPTSTTGYDSGMPDVLSEDEIKGCARIIKAFFSRFGRVSNADVVPYRAAQTAGVSAAETAGSAAVRRGRRSSVDIVDAAGASSGVGRALRERQNRRED